MVYLPTEVVHGGYGSFNAVYPCAIILAYLITTVFTRLVTVLHGHEAHVTSLVGAHASVCHVGQRASDGGTCGVYGQCLACLARLAFIAVAKRVDIEILDEKFRAVTLHLVALYPHVVFDIIYRHGVW